MTVQPRKARGLLRPAESVIRAIITTVRLGNDPPTNQKKAGVTFGGDERVWLGGLEADVGAVLKLVH